MIRTLRPIFSQSFVISLFATWLAIVLAAVVYYRTHPTDLWLFTAALPACLLESSFYLAATFEHVRAWFSQSFDRVQQSVVLYVSALLPYLIFAISAHEFDSRRFLLLAILTALLALWYSCVPRRIPYDLAFLAIAAAPVITRAFRRIYISPDPAIPLDILGHLMWIRVGITALLVTRPWQPGPFGLWPHRSEWRAGVVWYAIMVCPLCAVALAIGDVHLAMPAHGWAIAALTAVGTFFGILWVVALSEELFFRGFIERALLHARWSPVLAIATSAVLFGSAHLWFHHFPNWRRAIVAGLLGIGCGVAYQRTGSVRAPMVTHALTVATYRLLFN